MRPTTCLITSDFSEITYIRIVSSLKKELVQSFRLNLVVQTLFPPTLSNTFCHSASLYVSLYKNWPQMG